MRHAFRARTRVTATARAAALRSPAALLAVVLAALLAPGCALLPCHPPTPPRPRPGYERLRDPLAGVDASGLAGRRIVLDPGHGGLFRGAIGVRGLTEAEVNLGVALDLRDLLAAHGARVLMTRETDRDFLTPADSSLRADLAERARLARAFDPDLLVSIHHNADAGGAHDVNETQTYYKLGDDGPSLDVAEDVHRALVRNVGIAANQVLPGNFYVLRTSEAPAILTETSYITFPAAEKRLRRPEKQRLEAEALFIGLARYFARPVPLIAEFAADTASAPGPGPWESGARPDPVLRARVRGAFDEVRLEVDGVERSMMRADSLLWWCPGAALSGGVHEAALAVRRAGTGAARPRRLAFAVRRPVSGFEADARPGVVDSAGGPVLIAIRPVDTWGLPVLDSVRVRVRATRPGDVPADTELVIVGGAGWLHPRLAPRRAGAGAAGAVAGFHGELVRPPGPSSAMPPFFTARFEQRAEREPGPRAVVARLSAMPGDTVLRVGAGTWVDPDGYAVFELDSAGRAIVPALPGYRVWPDAASAAGAPPLRWTALCGGALHGRRIVLDPEGGGDDAAGQGPGGTRAARLNLQSARILAGFLAAAGADVRLTRDEDVPISDVERVRTAEDFHAERFVRLAHRTGPPRLGHYPGSAAGRAWAAHTATALGALGLPVPAAVEDAAYVVRQTSCPTLVASPSSLGSEAAESRLLAPGALRSEAYALFVALAREWAPDAAWPADSLTVLDGAGRPVPGAAVVLGAALVIETDALGRARFLRTEPGGMDVAVDDPRARVRAVLLESHRGAVLTGKTGR